MLKAPAVFALILAAIGAMSAYPYSSPHKDAERTQSAVNPPPSIYSYNYSSDDQNKPNERPEWWYKFVSWPEGATATALLISLIILVIQTNETRRAANAALASASASKDQATYLIASERPWIIVIPAESNPGTVKFVAINYGRTPARIVAERPTFTITSDEKSIPLLPIEGIMLNHPLMLLPNGSGEDKSDMVRRVIHASNVAQTLKGLSQEERDMIVKIQRCVIFYGIVVYDDMLSNSRHYTRYCYWWTPNEAFYLSGPEGANQNI